eukprot:TRINITY_DN5588_c0_g1_i1.p1 TRINITY_DN5588_c0_g1~~TRINITY_DN5588_c0_g1_i1.p1  ORF type:complete len:145 (-),score=30.50 TRINITY_DN5588_c0_g1_i1:97-531(-)
MDKISQTDEIFQNKKPVKLAKKKKTRQVRKRSRTGEIKAESSTNLAGATKVEKNRFAAQQFRLRQKENMTELEEKIKELKLQQTEYKAKVETLERENEKVRKEVLFMRDFIAEALALAYPFPNPVGCQQSIPLKPDPYVQSEAS